MTACRMQIFAEDERVAESIFDGDVSMERFDERIQLAAERD